MSITTDNLSHLSQPLSDVSPAKLASIEVKEVKDGSSSADSDDESVLSTDDNHPDTAILNPDVAKRQAQQAVLAEHVQRQLKRPKLQPSSTKLDDNVVDAKDESRYLLDKIRDYQQELFERAKQENVIAV